MEPIQLTHTRIDLLLPEYSKRRNVDLKEIYLLLYDNHMQYKCVADYECIDDDTELWKAVKSNYRWVRKRESISEITMYFDNPEQLWSVCIDFVGIADGNNWLFYDPKEALVVYNQLTDYMLR